MDGFDFSAIFSAIYRLIFGERNVFSAVDIFLFWWGLFSVLFSVVMVFVLAYLKIKIDELKQQENAKYAPDPKKLVVEQKVNPQWERVQKYLLSENPSDWKLAILEADTMLDGLVEKLGYRGENLGERLKAVEPSDFLTLEDAWEAHKVRNQIAHEGGFVLTSREVRKVINQYKNVFDEFNLL